MNRISSICGRDKKCMQHFYWKRDGDVDVDLRKIFIRTLKIAWWCNRGIDSAGSEEG